MRIVTAFGLAGLCLLAPLGVPGTIVFDTALAADAAGGPEDASAPENASTPNDRPQPDGTAVTLMSDTTHEGNAALAQDVAAVLDDPSSLRIVPMVGKGPEQAVRDVLFLDGVDLGITQSTVLNHFAQTGELGPIRDELVYVAKLFNEDLHLLSRSEIENAAALDGKTVNVGLEGSGTEIAARIVFEALGIAVQETHLDTAEAVRQLESGEIDAAFLIGATPIARVSQLGAGSGLKLLAIPYAKDLEDDTYPSALTHGDYPALIGNGQHVDTVSVSAVLVALNKPDDAKRQERLERFVDRFFSRFDVLRQPPNHPKWREVNFAATLEGWRRAPEAQAWIDNARTQALSDARERERFKAFLSQGGATAAADGDPTSEAEQDRLFRAFKAWSAAQKSN